MHPIIPQGLKRVLFPANTETRTDVAIIYHRYREVLARRVALHITRKIKIVLSDYLRQAQLRRRHQTLPNIKRQFPRR